MKGGMHCERTELFFLLIPQAVIKARVTRHYDIVPMLFCPKTVFGIHIIHKEVVAKGSDFLISLKVIKRSGSDNHGNTLQYLITATSSLKKKTAARS